MVAKNSRITDPIGRTYSLQTTYEEFKVDLIASEYESLMGEGLSLDGWIISYLCKLDDSLHKPELAEKIESTDRLGMLSLCCPETLSVLAEHLSKLMMSDRVRDRLREIQLSPELSIAIYGASKVVAVDRISEDFEYIPESEPIEFIGIDPETQAQILRAMEAA